MLGWLLYITGIAASLCLVGALSERGFRRLGRPVRWVWMSVMATTIGLPLTLALVSTVSVGSEAGTGDGVGGVPVDPSVSSELWSRIPSPPSSAIVDSVILWSWIAASLVLLVILLACAGMLRRKARSWSTGRVAGHPVILSADFGPAVVGALRPRIVLPGWILDWDESLQRLVVLHEREHLRAGDNRLLLGGLIVLGLLPWCPLVWWQFLRLRGAIEADCDGRVLTARVCPREYATVLLTVAGSRVRRVLPVAAFTREAAELERRIRLIASGTGARSSAGGLPYLATAVLATVGLWGLPAPETLPNVGFAAALEIARTHDSRTTENAGPDAILPDGSLPGTPDPERLAAEIRAHHGLAVASGLPSGSTIWFIVGEAGEVRRTGIQRGTTQDVAARIRARYPEETSEFSMGFDNVPAGSAMVRVVWMIPSPE